VDEGEGRALAGEFERGVGGGADGGLVGAPGHVVHRRALEARGDGGVAVAALARADVIDARDVRGDEPAGARGWRAWGGRVPGSGGGACGEKCEDQRANALSWHVGGRGGQRSALDKGEV